VQLGFTHNGLHRGRCVAVIHSHLAGLFQLICQLIYRHLVPLPVLSLQTC
jgi:hypothetical protein